MTGRKTRSTKSDDKKKKSKNVKIEASNHVFFLNDSLLSFGSDIKMQRLRHPGSETSAYFIINKQKQLIFEINQFNQPHRSWLIDDTVCSNGKCFLTLPMDFTYFALYYIKKNCVDRAVPIEQIEDDEFENTNQFLEDFSDESTLNMIADVKKSGDLTAYKYNKEKALIWLSIKVRRLSEKLKEKQISTDNTATSANYMKSTKLSEEVNPEEYLRLAAGIIGNYITNDLYEDIFTHLSLKKENITAKRKSVQSAGEETLSKKVKMNDSIEETKEKEKEKKTSTKEKALAKAAKGTKSISSFFKK